MSQTKITEPKGWAGTEVGEAFTETLRGRYLHCNQAGGWHRWDGRRWAKDQTAAVCEEFKTWVTTLLSQVMTEMAEVTKSQRFQQMDDAAQKAILDPFTNKIKNIRKYMTARAIKDTVWMSEWSDQESVAVTADIFDTHPDLLNVGNGVIDLRTGELRPHDPMLYMTKVTLVNYYPDQVHVDLEKAKKANKPSVLNWLHKWFGYCATGQVSEDSMPVFDGTGANGKTTILLAVAEALGDYAGMASPSLLMKGAHEQHPTIFADLVGKRLVYVEETAEGGKLAVETMKALTGGSKVKGRFMRGDFFEFMSTHKLVVATNFRPIVNSTDYATWRRLRLIPFPFRYSDPQDPQRRPSDLDKDTGLRKRLREGKVQQEAVLAWVVAGAKRWYASGLGFADDITEATQAWRLEEDVILRFLTESENDQVIGFDPEVQILSSMLYDIYKEWCEAQGRPSGSNKTFTDRMESHDEVMKRGVSRQRKRQGTVWTGVGTMNQIGYLEKSFPGSSRVR